MSDLWIGTLISIPIGLSCGAAVALYSKELVNWKEDSARSRKIRKAAREADDNVRAKAFHDHPEEANQFLILFAIRLILGMGAITMGTLFLIVASVMFTLHVPHYPLWAENLDEAFKLLAQLCGFVLYGFGVTILISLFRELKRILNAQKRLKLLSNQNRNASA